MGQYTDFAIFDAHVGIKKELHPRIRKPLSIYPVQKYRQVPFGLFDGREDGNHKSVGLVKIFKIFAMQGNLCFYFGTAIQDKTDGPGFVVLQLLKKRSD